ncbi:MAG: hypothetical protein IME97_02920 [Proteobacteria bacterium]|nr:hypothetical protein [Pseudomonadota bacterium]
MKRWHLIIAITLLFLSGCTHMGPKTVTRDRFDYNTAIANSWKEQTLLNIVKIRYLDMPLFVDVASIVSGYTLQGTVNLASTWSSDRAVQGDFFSMGSSGTFTDRPTITYKPVTGQQFNKSFMTPIPPAAILFLVQTGWPADLIYKITVDSVNGLRGRVSGGVNARLGDPKFFRMVELMREIQKSGVVGMRIIHGQDNQDTTIMFFHKVNIPPEIDKARQELGSLLGLRPGLHDVKVSYGLIPKDDTEIAMLTRSMMQIMIELATQFNVPEEHLTEGRTVPSLTGESDDYLIRINHSKEYPENGFVAIRYRDYWFYIDDRDLLSKRTFAFLMILFSLMETGGTEGLPIVTIPAG